jgi:ABC-2 type transport system ATP-binding protein
VRAALAHMDSLRSVAQLGSRLHLLVAPELKDAEAAVQQLLRSAGITAQVTRTTAGLEDVFVATTRKAEHEQAVEAAAGSAAPGGAEGVAR